MIRDCRINMELNKNRIESELMVNYNIIDLFLNIISHVFTNYTSSQLEWK
jgi:hypothetical protein